MANILIYAGNEGSILHIIYDHVGINALKKLDLFIRPSTVLLLTLGYLVTFLWLTGHARSKLALAKSLPIAGVVLAAFTVNITLAVPDEPELQGILDHNSWTN